MNWLLFISGILVLFTVIGHFTMGYKNYLKPMLEATFDDIAKKVMLSVFHYVSVFLVLSAATLIALGLGCSISGNINILVKFIAVNFALFAITQIIIACTSKIEKGIFKLFQWVFFILIAVTAWLGIVL